MFESKSHRILICLLLAASLVPVWSASYFPSQNGPWHVLVSKMLHDYVAGTSFNYFDYYRFAPHFIPHLLHTMLVAALHLFFPILIAHKLAISLYVLLLPLSVFAFLSSVDPRKTIYGYTSFLIVYNLPLMRGYHDFALGIPVVFFTLAYWLRTWDRQTRMRPVILAGLIMVAFLSHIFNFLILGLTILLFAYSRTRSVTRTIVALLPFLPSSLLVADFAFLVISQPAWMSRSDLEIFGPYRSVEHLLEFTYTLSWSAAVISLVPLSLAAYAAGKALRDAVRDYRRTGQFAAGVYFLLAGVLLVAYFAMPHKFFGWHYANTRFIPFFLVAVLACASSYLDDRFRRMLLTVNVTAAIAVYALLTVQFVRADHQLKAYISGIDYFQSNGLLYPIHFREDPVGRILPLTRAHEYYHVFRGGANGRGLAMFSTLTPMPYRIYPIERQFPVWRPVDSDLRTAHLAEHYDQVLSWGTNDQLAASLTKANFKLAYQSGPLHLYTNGRGRDARIRDERGAGE
jgi:hypothetical protein